MSATHTMTPGRIVHYSTDSLGRLSCVPAMIEKPISGDGGVATLALLADEPAGGRRVRALPIHHDANGAPGRHPNTWHWLDECQIVWPETD